MSEAERLPIWPRRSLRNAVPTDLSNCYCSKIAPQNHARQHMSTPLTTRGSASSENPNHTALRCASYVLHCTRRWKLASDESVPAWQLRPAVPAHRTTCLAERHTSQAGRRQTGPHNLRARNVRCPGRRATEERARAARRRRERGQRRARGARQRRPMWRRAHVMKAHRATTCGGSGVQVGGRGVKRAPPRKSCCPQSAVQPEQLAYYHNSFDFQSTYFLFFFPRRS